MAAAATGSADIAASFSLSGFDAAAPQAFYLWEQGEDMEAMADACLIVEGTRLPVHTQVLSLACAVLRRMFADLRSAAAEGTPSCKRKADDVEQELTIEAPFAGFSVPDVALFLRLLYDSRWQSAAAATFEQLGDSLPAMLRLAHQLEARQLLSALCSYMAGCTKRAQLISMLLEAEACQLEELRNSCLLRLAHNVAEWGPDLAFSLAQASLLERCGARTLAQLLGIVAAAAAQPRKAREQLAGMLPSAADLEPALQAAANPGQFLWTIEKFFEQPSEVGACVKSPEFMAAGHTWQLQVYPGTKYEHQPGCFLSVWLECRQRGQGPRGRYTVDFLDEDGVAQFTQSSKTRAFQYGQRHGWDNMFEREEAADLGLLAGDCLRLRITVTLVP